MHSNHRLLTRDVCGQDRRAKHRQLVQRGRGRTVKRQFENLLVERLHEQEVVEVGRRLLSIDIKKVRVVLFRDACVKIVVLDAVECFLELDLGASRQSIHLRNGALPDLR
jgi:hypothetical protein